ncbi:hypothetical protein CLCHR_23740 [Clostridium chromiireducens]|uniref:Uncharacterized protein n=1 Tax=Clostridium chromiireducens TaxID=225345 RepID=A0A1V4IP40_9CLOT|nr:hypothetical protein [Clostridium chromiireducens]OPJ61580.1 hypothetical protein CLCHR_23740 [Clostridium chromiireducens]
MNKQNYLNSIDQKKEGDLLQINKKKLHYKASKPSNMAIVPIAGLRYIH